MSREDGKQTMAARARAVLAKEFWRWWKESAPEVRREVIGDLQQQRELRIYVVFAAALRSRIVQLDPNGTLERADQETVFRRILPDLPSFLKTLETVRDGLLEAQIELKGAR